MQQERALFKHYLKLLFGVFAEFNPGRSRSLHRACFVFLIRLFAEFISRKGIPLQLQNKNTKNMYKTILTQNIGG